MIFGAYHNRDSGVGMSSYFAHVLKIVLMLKRGPKTPTGQ